MSKKVANLTLCKAYKTKMETHKVVVKHFEKYRRIMYQAFCVPSYLIGEQMDQIGKTSIFVCMLLIRT